MIADFGLADWVGNSEYKRSLCGSPGYIAPEMYNEVYDEKVDIFSLGVTLYALY